MTAGRLPLTGEISTVKRRCFAVLEGKGCGETGGYRLAKLKGRPRRNGKVDILTLMSYLSRVVDKELDELLPSLPAVALEGAKGVGKQSPRNDGLRRFTRLMSLERYN